MMTMRTRDTPRGLGASAAAVFGGILSLVLLLGVAVGSPAHAADAVFPDGPKTLVIHPGIAPGPADQPGTGLPPAAGSPGGIPGHAYEVKRVPGFDLEKTVDWNRAVDLTAAEAAPLVAGEPAATEGITGADESITFGGLADGLYLVTETAAPGGAIRANPFLVALPLPDPAEDGAWLTTVHVFPKTASVSVALEVRDATAVTSDDPVGWVSLSAIPPVATLASYRVQHVLADGVALRGTADDTVVEIVGAGRPRAAAPASGATIARTATSTRAATFTPEATSTRAATLTRAAPLTSGVDYSVEATEVDGRAAIETVFTEAGIAKLLADTTAEVRISLSSSVAGPGEFVNEVRLFAGDAGAVTDTATTKFGPLRILVHERGNPDNRIAGAEFRLFTSEAAARGGSDPIEFAGGHDLRTNADGLIEVLGLRYSNHADGLDREPGDELFRDYFAKPVSYPAGWTGEDVILRGSVTSADTPETLRAVVWRESSVIPEVPGLSETGGRIAAIALLGATLVAVGVLVVARRRREQRAP